MANLTLQLTDDVYSELKSIAEQLKISPEDCAQIALHHFMQTDTVENAIEGVARSEDGQALVDFPELKEELGLEILFHPDAMDELESVVQEDQIDILERLINRISQHDESEATLDVVIKEVGDTQLVITGFSFGDIVYQIGKNVIIYHIALIEEDEIEDEGDEDEEEDENEVEDEGQDEEDFEEEGEKTSNM